MAYAVASAATIAATNTKIDNINIEISSIIISIKGNNFSSISIIRISISIISNNGISSGIRISNNQITSPTVREHQGIKGQQQHKYWHQGTSISAASIAATTPTTEAYTSEKVAKA